MTTPPVTPHAEQTGARWPSVSSVAFLFVGAVVIVVAGYLLLWTDQYPGADGDESRTFHLLAPSLIRADQLAPVLVIVTIALWITPVLSVLSPLTRGSARYAAIGLMALTLVGAIAFAIVNETQLKAEPDPGFAIGLVVFAAAVCGLIAWLAWRGRTWWLAWPALVLSVVGMLGAVATLVYNLLEGSVAFLPWAWFMPVGFALTTQGSWSLLRERPRRDDAGPAHRDL